MLEAFRLNGWLAPRIKELVLAASDTRPCSFRYSLPALMRSAVVFLTQSTLVFLHSSQPDGSFFCTNMISRSLTETVGSPSSSRASGLLARKANNRPNSPAEPTKLWGGGNLV